MVGENQNAEDKQDGQAMNDDAAFLAKIIANRGDDAPRLVYADWLEEHGHGERAEFIRLQCALHSYQREREWLEQMPASQWTGDKDTGILLLRLEPLVSRHLKLCHLYVQECGKWSREFVDGILGKNWLQMSSMWQWYFARGFVSEVTIPWSDWLAHADAILAVTPLERLELATWPDPIDPSLPGDVGERMVLVLAKRWPGITFTLPRIHLNVGSVQASVWTGASGNMDASDPANCSGGRVPQAGDDVVLIPDATNPPPAPPAPATSPR